MNVTIIYGSMNKANAYYNCIQLLLDNLKSNINLNITEVFSSNNVSYSYNRRCSSINTRISNNLYDESNIKFIAKSLYKADLIIIACTTFTCDLSSEMKNLLDNLSCYYMKNKEHNLGNNKIGLIISTASGAGLFHVNRIIKKNLNFWGIHNIFHFSQNIYEGDWEYINLRTKRQIAQKILNLSYKILSLHNKTQLIKPQVFTSGATKAIPSPVYNFSHHKKRYIQ
ncbi:MAG: NAD(P)H-dependent oxidoreductase [Clostridium sp.]|nr:NAD(P)H-dependent oxidoreductase [Clostridium sp.]